MIVVFLNLITIIIATFIGCKINAKIKKETSDNFFKLFGIIIFVIGIKGVIEGQNTMVLFLSFFLGSVIGESIDIDKHFNNFTVKILKKRQLFKKGKKDIEETKKAIIISSLTICVGAMTIMGSFDLAFTGNTTLLQIKTCIDFFSAIIMSASMGFGVMVAGVINFIYEIILILFAGIIKNVLIKNIIIEIDACGSVVLICMALNMINLTKFKILNLLPSIIIVPIIYNIIQMVTY